VDPIEVAEPRDRREVDERARKLVGNRAERVREQRRLRGGALPAVLPLDVRDARRAREDRLGCAAVDSRGAPADDTDETAAGARDVRRAERVAVCEVVRAEEDHHRVERRVRVEARDEVVEAVLPRRERAVEGHRAPGQPLLDDVPVVAERRLQAPGPAHAAREPGLVRRVHTPGVRVAEAEDGAHPGATIAA
jgi:hypothetical protein